VWKTIVANTPKTLREIMPVLMDTLIASLASASSERRQVCTYIYIYIYFNLCSVTAFRNYMSLMLIFIQVAGRSLGELVRKLGERVLPLIIPILSQGLSDPDSSRRQVSIVCGIQMNKKYTIDRHVKSP
jgi:hypothetical protein